MYFRAFFPAGLGDSSPDGPGERSILIYVISKIKNRINELRCKDARKYDITFQKLTWAFYQYNIQTYYDV